MPTEIEISLFIKGVFKDRMKRSTIPRVGETIVIDCGEMVRVIAVDHPWDSPNLVQIQTIEVEV